MAGNYKGRAIPVARGCVKGRDNVAGKLRWIIQYKQNAVNVLYNDRTCLEDTVETGKQTSSCGE